MGRNLKAAVVFLCIFLAGGVAGAFVGMRIACTKAKNRPASPGEGYPPPPHHPIDDWAKRKQKEFVTRLELTPDQQIKTSALLQGAQSEFRTVREHSFQQIGAIASRLDAQIMSLLNEAQQTKFQQIIKEREERFKKAAAERAAASERNERSPTSGEPLQPPPMRSPQGPSSPSDVASGQSAIPAEPPKSP
jgi:uncharacterized membrane protein